jgi:NADPH-dependent curcumin reductase CurA
MKTGINRQLRLASRPVGDIKESDFEYREEPIPSPQQRVRYWYGLSIFR